MLPGQQGEYVSGDRSRVRCRLVTQTDDVRSVHQEIQQDDHPRPQDEGQGKIAPTVPDLRGDVGAFGFQNRFEWQAVSVYSYAWQFTGYQLAALIGYQVAGYLGSIVACLAMFGPSSLVLSAAASWWQNYPDSRVKRSIERSLGPVALALLFAGALAIIEAMVSDAAAAAPPVWLTLGAIAFVTAVLYWSRLNPYWLVLSVGVGFLGLKLLVFA